MNCTYGKYVISTTETPSSCTQHIMRLSTESTFRWRSECNACNEIDASTCVCVCVHKCCAIVCFMLPNCTHNISTMLQHTVYTLTSGTDHIKHLHRIAFHGPSYDTVILLIDFPMALTKYKHFTKQHSIVINARLLLCSGAKTQCTSFRKWNLCSLFRFWFFFRFQSAREHFPFFKNFDMAVSQLVYFIMNSYGGDTLVCVHTFIEMIFFFCIYKIRWTFILIIVCRIQIWANSVDFFCVLFNKLLQEFWAKCQCTFSYVQNH